MSTRRAPTGPRDRRVAATADAPATPPDLVQQLLAERRDLKVANERLRLEAEEARAAERASRSKPDRRMSLLEEENRRLRQELAAVRAENERLLDGVALVVEDLERATGGAG